MPARHQGMKTRKIEDDRAGVLMDFRNQPRRAPNGRGNSWQTDSEEGYGNPEPRGSIPATER